MAEVAAEQTANQHSAGSQQTSTDSGGLNDEECPICMDQLDNPQTLPCSHKFCKDCLDQVKSTSKSHLCPVCRVPFAVAEGKQPKGGQMQAWRLPSSLPGYANCGTIALYYSIPSGIQGPEHPKPGVPYSGTSRQAFLPDSDKGNLVLRLLWKAFDRRLTFTVGQSITSGRDNTVVWNDIHHKTSQIGGPSQYGYPDPDYMDRVIKDLQAKGITESEILDVPDRLFEDEVEGESYYLIDTDEYSESDSDTLYTDSDTHSTDSDTHSTDSDTHYTDNDAHPTDSDIHPTDSDTHSTDSGIHYNDTDTHPTDSDTHYTDNDAHPTDSDTHPTDSDTHSPDNDTHYTDRDTHSPDNDTHYTDSNEYERHIYAGEWAEVDPDLIIETVMASEGCDDMGSDDAGTGDGDLSSGEVDGVN